LLLGDHDRKDLAMSLDVPPTLLRQAETGTVDEAAFVATVRESLPYAYGLVARLVDELDGSGLEFTDNQVPPPSAASCSGRWPATPSGAAWSATSAFAWPSRTATEWRPSA
jgi:hypothetical protein